MCRHQQSIDYDCVDEDYCFRWEPVSEILFDGKYQQEPFVSPAQSTWFTIYMTDGQGNLFMDSVFVEVSDGPDFVIASDQTHLCTGDSLTLTADIQQGSGSYSYAWSTGATTPGTTVYTGDTYSLSITDLADGCTSSQSITIAEPNLSFAIVADHDFICTGSPNSTLTVPGADATNYQYLWSTSETSASISINQAGEYQLTLTDAIYGCDTVLQYTVQDVDQELSMAIMATDTVLCENDTLLLSTTIDGLTLDTEEITYLWSNDQATPAISASQAGTYSVTVTFGGVCSLNSSITLTEAMLDLAVISTSGENFACPESPLTLTSSTLDSTAITAWSWSTGETSETITVSEVGTFSLTVTDQNGCPFAADFTVAGCPTVVFLEQELVQIKDDETAEVCVGIVNPGTVETTVDLVFVDTKDPHFAAQPLSQTVTFAAGVNSLCLDFPSVRIEDADSVTVYALQLTNANGGTNATIGLARETSIAVESAIRCQVEQDSLPVNCELSDTSTIVSDVPLISRLEKEDSFWAGDFEVEVVNASGNGLFYGKGIIIVPYLNQARINVDLKAIEVNENCQMVAGEIIVEGIGLRILDDDMIGALSNLLNALDDIEDLIEQADAIITQIDNMISIAEEYLSPEIMQTLLDAQAAVAAAQAEYEAAVASGDPEAIAAAEQALEEALEQLQQANQEYRVELFNFFLSVFNIIIRAINELEEEYIDNLSTLEAEYLQAEQLLDNYLDSLNSVDNTGPQATSTGLTIITRIETADEPTFPSEMVALSNNYYDAEIQYAAAEALTILKTEILTVNQALDFAEDMKSAGYDVLAVIAEHRQLGWRDVDIVPPVKQEIIDFLSLTILNVE